MANTSIFQQPGAPTVGLRFALPAGVPGDMAYDGPLRSRPWTLQSSGTPNIVGATGYTVTSEGIARAGGGTATGLVTVPFAGILVNPKAYTFGYGVVSTPSNPIGPDFVLYPTMTLPDGSLGELATMGTFFATSVLAAAVGDLVTMHTTTGALSALTFTSGTPTAPANFAVVPNARWVLRAVGALGLGIIELTD